MPAVTGTPTTFGGIGRVEWAPTNAPDDPFPTWVDITQYVRSENTPMDATRVRQTELDTVQPSVFTVILDNTDLRFTFGLLSGPYGANWQPAKQIRWIETIGSRTFQIFKGYLEAPDITNWADIGYQEISLSCTDRLTRLGRGRPFVSTLGAQIVWAGGTSLTDYYPLNETVGPTVRDFSSLGYLTETTQGFAGSSLAALVNHPSVHYGVGPALLADDLMGLSYDPYLDASGSGQAVRWTAHRGALSPTFVVNSGETAAVVCWVNWTALTVNGPPLFLISNAAATTTLTLFLDSSSGTYRVSCRDDSGGSVSTIIGRPYNVAQWVLLALRISEPSGLVELWANADAPVTGTIAGTPTVFTATNLQVGGYANASFAHLQVYHGVNAYTRAQHLAQYQAALTGLEWQSTGARINTVLDYAGVPTADRAVDPGCSYMQRASLAGQAPGAAILNAVSTERGRGFAGGDGRYVFHDRTRIYNV